MSNLTTQQMLKKAFDAQQPHLASMSRCKEILAAGEISLLEFIELTGVGEGNYGTYQISEQGVSVPATNDISGSAPSQQADLLRARKHMSLSFPCSPQQFLDWYKVTESKPGKDGEKVSDFPLVKGFREAVEGRTIPRHSVTSAQIKEAFALGDDWWDERMRDAKRYKIVDFRADRGSAKKPSLWYPDLLGAWLSDHGHMPRDKVVKAIEKHFPKVDLDHF